MYFIKNKCHVVKITAYCQKNFIKVLAFIESLQYDNVVEYNEILPLVNLYYELYTINWLMVRSLYMQKHFYSHYYTEVQPAHYCISAL